MYLALRNYLDVCAGHRSGFCVGLPISIQQYVRFYILELDIMLQMLIVFILLYNFIVY